MTLIIGVDFDNTIVCYDNIFHRVALERNLILPETPRTKEDVRAFLRARGREDDWTELQGYVYGARMNEVEPHPGVLNFFKTMIRTGVPIYIISHKTKFPYKGPQYDLHKAALGWLDHWGFFDAGRIGLGASRVFFVETKEEKLRRIGELGCSHFIDDLPELLLEKAFPKTTKKILFSPRAQPVGAAREERELSIVSSWAELHDYFQNDCAYGGDKCLLMK